jgi:hypothetical protein
MGGIPIINFVIEPLPHKRRDGGLAPTASQSIPSSILWEPPSRTGSGGRCGLVGPSRIPTLRRETGRAPEMPPEMGWGKYTDWLRRASQLRLPLKKSSISKILYLKKPVLTELMKRFLIKYQSRNSLLEKSRRRIYILYFHLTLPLLLHMCILWKPPTKHRIIFFLTWKEASVITGLCLN